MGRIFQELKIWGRKGEKDVDALFDGGASHSVISREVCDAIDDIVPFRDEEGNIITKEITLADGKTRLKAFGTCPFQTHVNTIDINHYAWVVENLVHPMIIGADTMQQFNIELKYATKGKGGDKIMTPAQEEIAWL